MRISRALFHQLSDAESLESDRRYELIDGDIIEKMGQKEPHASLVMDWIFALAEIFGPQFVRCQAPILANDFSEPEPDIAVTSKPRTSYRRSSAPPPASDIRLVIEISVTTAAYDTGRNALLYAQCGISEYWVSDVANRRLIVHRDPTPNGYSTVTTLSEMDKVTPLAATAASLKIADFLP